MCDRVWISKDQEKASKSKYKGDQSSNKLLDWLCLSSCRLTDNHSMDNLFNIIWIRRKLCVCVCVLMVNVCFNPLTEMEKCLMTGLALASSQTQLSYLLSM